MDVEKESGRGSEVEEGAAAAPNLDLLVGSGQKVRARTLVCSLSVSASRRWFQVRELSLSTLTTFRDSLPTGPTLSLTTPKLSPRRKPSSNKLVGNCFKTADMKLVPRSKTRRGSRRDAKSTPPRVVRSGSAPVSTTEPSPGGSAHPIAHGSILTSPIRRLELDSRHRPEPNLLAMTMVRPISSIGSRQLFCTSRLNFDTD
jgi:hypothetical protein